MSRYTGPQYRGASRDALARRREEAQERQERFDAEVVRKARNQNCGLIDARSVVNALRRIEYRMAQR
jgi:hypothetical protein